MAVTQTPTSNPFGANIYTDTDANATKEDDIGSGAKTVYMVDINNPSAEKVYFKGYDNASPTVGATAVDLLLPCAAGARRQYTFTKGLNFATALSTACVQEAGDAGTTSPSSAVTTKVLTN